MPKQWSNSEKAKLFKLYKQGLSMKEIALELDRPKNGVIGMLHRIREANDAADKAVPYTIQSRHHRDTFVRIRFKRHKTPQRAHPLVKRLIELMNEQQCSIEQLCNAVGMSRTTFNMWKWKHVPQLELLIACYNYLGRDLSDVPIKEDAEDE